MSDVEQQADEAHNWKWAKRFLRVAYEIASWSKDPSTQVGAVAIGEGHRILAVGYNGLPRMVRDAADRMERPAKYMWTIHAEANLVANAASHGIRLSGATVYVTHCPCSQCAASLIQAGVRRVVVDSKGVTHMDPENFAVARVMFDEASVEFNSLKVEEPTSGQ